jgi:hypothetical protein
MTRRGLFGMLGMFAVPVAEHTHDFKESPLFLACSASFEEPGYYPPSHFFAVQMCSCGAVRVDPKYADKLYGKNYVGQ